MCKDLSEFCWAIMEPTSGEIKWVGGVLPSQYCVDFFFGLSQERWLETTPPKSHCNKPNNPPLSFLFSLSHPTQKSFTSLSQKHTLTVCTIQKRTKKKRKRRKERWKREKGSVGLEIGHTFIFFFFSICAPKSSTYSKHH